MGSWLLRHLRERGWRSLATCMPGKRPPPIDTDRGQVEWVEIDLRDPIEVGALLRRHSPRHVVHLAAIAVPRQAAADPLEALRTNYVMPDLLLRAMREHAPRGRFLFVGTGEAYGPRPQGSPPLPETEPLHPPTPYSATKAAGEVRALLAAEREGLDVLAARPLNHSGPGRPALYAESSFAQQIVRIERGEQEPVLRVGNLDEVRDFSDVRDVVRGYTLLLERGERGGVYNVCSGRGWRIHAVLEHLIHGSPIEPRIEVDPALSRPLDPRRCTLVGDPSRLRALGWTPRHRFEETLDDLLEDWRTRA